ncbi:hypothetical protein [Aurantimonas sp. VKM B-3413]|uniref:hypothetical protein n=1 Tax=Aurantimonas sp. VKM B-3413 TaxID=2779401 RepID=UPI001E5F7A6D|nr:hypothetical protein [Aurantimonas sp. VKM B-3413]MCB8836514.1 hypothetical protein [Aurantimonas sp. VKM B-3413]
MKPARSGGRIDPLRQAIIACLEPGVHTSYRDVERPDDRSAARIEAMAADRRRTEP